MISFPPMSPRRWAVFTLAAIFSIPAFPNTYYFAGTINPVAGSASISIPPGTPFTGTITIDPNVPHCNCADDQHRNYDYTTGTPPGSWQVHIGNGLYDFATTSVGMEEDHNYGLFFGGGDVIWFWANPTPPPSITGTGQAANPISFSNLSSVLLWSKKPGTILANANTFSVSNIVNIGQWNFAGIDFSVQQGTANGEHYRGAFTKFSSTPLDGGTPKPTWCCICLILLLVLCLLLLILGLVWLTRRRRRRGTATRA
jgi:hypothetical protein